MREHLSFLPPMSHVSVAHSHRMLVCSMPQRPLSLVLVVAHFLAPPSYTCRYMYTLKVSDAEKADKLTQSLPPGLQRKDI